MIFYSPQYISLGYYSFQVQKNNKKIYKDWDSGGQKKIVIRLQNIHELYALKSACEELGLFTTIIMDAGKTQVNPMKVPGLQKEGKCNRDHMEKGRNNSVEYTQ